MSSTATVTIPQAMEAIANDPSQFISRLAAPTVRPETIGTDVSGTQFKGTFFRTDWQGLSVAGRSLVKAPGSAIKQVNPDPDPKFASQVRLIKNFDTSVSQL